MSHRKQRRPVEGKAGMNITITRGLDVPVDGAPEAVIEPGAPVGTVALIGADYVGLEPRMRVQAVRQEHSRQGRPYTGLL